MARKADPGIACRLKEIRTRTKLTQGGLAEQVGLKRQAIYDIEAGRYLPNTGTALRMARVLGCRVEDLFYETDPQNCPVTLVDLPGTSGARVNVAKVRGKLFAYPLSGENAIEEGLKSADALLDDPGKSVRLLKPDQQIDHGALLLGCDPAFPILSSHFRRNIAEASLRCRFASSKKSLTCLAKGQAHIAGTHMHNCDAEDGNRRLAKKILKGTRSLLVAFSMFEEGLMVARGNPKGIRTAADLAGTGVCFVNREKGAALRSLIDDTLAAGNIPCETVSGYDQVVHSHLQGAWRIKTGISDAALGLRAVATALELDFIPISQVRCDLVIPEDLQDHPGVKAVLDTLQTSRFRNELNALPGYEASCSGKVICRI